MQREMCVSMSPKRLYAHTLAAEPKSNTWWCHSVGPSGVCNKTYATSGSRSGSCLYKLRRGRGPTLFVYLVCDDISVVLSWCSGLVYDGMVGHPFGMHCCGLISANLRLFLSWVSHRIPSVVCWRPLQWLGNGVAAVVSARSVWAYVGELWGVRTILVPRMVLAFFLISLRLQSLLPSVPSVCRYELVLASSVCTLGCVVVVRQCLLVVYICCRREHATVILVGGDPGVGNLDWVLGWEFVCVGIVVSVGVGWELVSVLSYVSVCKLFGNVRARNGANVWSLLLVVVSWSASHRLPSSWWWACPSVSVCQGPSWVLGRWVLAFVPGVLVVWPNVDGFANLVAACWSCLGLVLVVRTGMGCSTTLLSSGRWLGWWVGMVPRLCWAKAVRIVARSLWASARHYLVPYCAVCLSLGTCCFVWSHLVTPWVSRAVWERV